MGPLDSWTLADNSLPEGVDFDCGTVEVWLGTPEPGTGRFIRDPGPAGNYTGTVTTTCTERSLAVNLGAVPAGKLVQYRISADLDVATGVGTRFTFSNEATFTVTRNGVTTVTPPSRTNLVQVGGGGDAAGEPAAPVIKIVKKDAAGNDADTEGDAAALGTPPGATGLVYTITNTGNEPLANVTVSDTLVRNGTITGLTCDFSPLGGPPTGVIWAGIFKVGDSFTCTAQLSDVALGSVHANIGHVTAVGAFSAIPVNDDNPYHATVTTTPPPPPPTPKVQIVKKDEHGNDADTPDDAASLGTAPGATGLVYTITNTGEEALRDVTVTDTLVRNGTITGLTCDFSALGGPATGTTWAGPFAVGASFTCTAQLSDVQTGSTHENVGTVTGIGVESDKPVTDTNPYHATVTTKTTPPPTSPPPTTPTKKPSEGPKKPDRELADTGADTATLAAGLFGMITMIAGARLVFKRRYH